MADDDDRAREEIAAVDDLACALHKEIRQVRECYDDGEGTVECWDLAEAILSTVRALMDQAAARALEDAATVFARGGDHWHVRDLRDRARALTAEHAGEQP